MRLQPLSHDHVIRLLGVCFRSEPHVLVLEYMGNGDLKTFLRNVSSDESLGRIIKGEHLLKLSVDCAKGFQYLQSINYVHRDLAARNVLLSRTYVAKIGDFGE